MSMSPYCIRQWMRWRDARIRASQCCQQAERALCLVVSVELSRWHQQRRIGPVAPYCGEESPREFQTCQTSVIQASKQASKQTAIILSPPVGCDNYCSIHSPASRWRLQKGQATGKHEANRSGESDVPPRQGALGKLTRGNSFEVMHQPATSSIPVWLVIRWLAVVTRKGVLFGVVGCQGSTFFPQFIGRGEAGYGPRASFGASYVHVA